jgi:dihydrofolate reductase
MGRVTYQEMATFWSTSTDPFAAVMNERPEVVFSKTLTRADWATSTIARGGLAEEVVRLRGQPGDDVIVYGGYSLAPALSQQDLVDEYRLVTRSVARGSGEPLFKDLPTAPAPAG